MLPYKEATQIIMIKKSTQSCKAKRGFYLFRF